MVVLQLMIGPTTINMLLEHNQMIELLWLLQTQKQPRNQTNSETYGCYVVELLASKTFHKNKGEHVSIYGTL